MNDAEVLDSIRERLEPIFDIDRVVLLALGLAATMTRRATTMCW